jgi:hypothetical protein
LTLSLLILILTSSCGGTYHAYYQTLKIAFSEQTDIERSLSDVKTSDVDLISVRHGESSSAIMALAYIENDQHKWVSSDNAMLIMEKGRIVRTLGLNDDLLYLSNTDIDPLKLLSSLDMMKGQQTRYTWSRIADRSGDEYGYPIESTFNQTSQDILQALDLDIEATLYVETLNYDAPATYLQLNNSWKNYFWYEKSGVLIKSIQQISPLSESLEITYLSRIARLNQ